MLKQLYAQKNKGQAVMLSLILFLGVSVSVIFAISGPVIQHLHIMRDSFNSKQVFYIAESLTEDILYRLNHGMEVTTIESLSANGFTADASIISGSGNKEIEVIAEKDGINRKVKSRVTTTTGLSFNYGVQTGNGGVVMAPNASIIGNIYANGDISGGSVTETAVAANNGSTASDQSNSTPIPATQSIIFRNTASTQDFAQSFRVSSSTYINKVQFYIKKTGSPSNATVRIVRDSSGSPGVTNVFSTNGTLTATQVTTSYGWAEVVFPEEATLTAGTTYWVIIDSTSHSAANYYEIAANSAYADGSARIGAYSGSWSNTTPTGLDGYFNVYIGGNYSSITNVVVGQDSWAHTISGGSTGATKYCQVGTGCNTSRPDPSPQGFPISEANIRVWKDEATAGGAISSFTSTSSSRIGPKKINGNLTLTGGSETYLDGVTWVTGDITVNIGATLRLSSEYGSSGGILIADGRIYIRNNSQFYGSGEATSYILALSTSDCPTSPSCSGDNAIELANNVGAVILYAQNGTLHLSNNAGAKEATAYKLTMDNGATIEYETGFSSMSFSSGPGGAWRIDAWQEIE